MLYTRTMDDTLSARYHHIELGYTEREVAIAREVVTETALRGYGYEQDYRVALRTARVALASVVNS